MRVKVIALSKDDFQAWAEKQIQPFEAPTDESAHAGFEQFASQCTTCHRITGMTEPSDKTGTKVFKYPPVINQVSGNAPNLTKLMTRTTFAGAKFDLRLPTKECKALGVNWIKEVPAYQQGQLQDALREAIAYEGFAVVIAKHPCMLKFLREKARKLAARTLQTAGR